jgi:hypothetical protein
VIGQGKLFLEKVDPQAHAQGHVLALGKDRVNAVGRGRKIVQHGAQTPRGDVGLHLPGAAPRNAITGQTPLVQDLPVAAIQRAARAQMGDLHLAVGLG